MSLKIFATQPFQVARIAEEVLQALYKAQDDWNDELVRQGSEGKAIKDEKQSVYRLGRRIQGEIRKLADGRALVILDYMQKQMELFLDDNVKVTNLSLMAKSFSQDELKAHLTSLLENKYLYVNQKNNWLEQQITDYTRQCGIVLDAEWSRFLDQIETRVPQEGGKQVGRSINLPIERILKSAVDTAHDLMLSLVATTGALATLIAIPIVQLVGFVVAVVAYPFLNNRIEVHRQKAVMSVRNEMAIQHVGVVNNLEMLIMEGPHEDLKKSFEAQIALRDEKQTEKIEFLEQGLEMIEKLRLAFDSVKERPQQSRTQESEDSSSNTPQVLILISAQREIEKAFPEGLRLDQVWTERNSTNQLAADTIEQADVVIWGMSAMHMFPAEFKVALDVARRERIPIWAVVVGVGRVGDKESFLRTTIPARQAQLPAHSEMLIYQVDGGELIIKQLRELLAEYGATLATAGRARRLNHLAQQVRKRLLAERQALQVELEHGERFTDTGQRGIEALKVLSSTVADAILVKYNSLFKFLEKLDQELQEIVNFQSDALDFNALGQKITAQIQEWRFSTLERELDRLLEESRERIIRWCSEYTQELESFFHSFSSLGDGPQTIGDMLILTPGHVLPQIEPILAGMKAEILTNFDRFLLRLQYDFRQSQKIQSESKPDEREEEETDESSMRARQISQQQDTAPSQQKGFGRKVQRLAETAMNLVLGGQWTEEDYHEYVREEMLYSLATRQREFGDVLAATIKVRHDPLARLLEKIVEDQGNACLQMVDPLVAKLRTRIAQISQGEQMLGGRGW